MSRFAELRGAPIRLRFLPDLHAGRGRLNSGGAGQAVHAGSFVRSRRMVLDSCLLAKPREFARIVVHELFHFAWVRAGNPVRLSWERVLLGEAGRGARGELGWSAEMRKAALKPLDAARRTQRWREYACESFCDTAAWLLAGPERHDEFTLAQRARARRAAWFHNLAGRGAISI